jgi:pantoate--beta-alanine ligase
MLYLDTLKSWRDYAHEERRLGRSVALVPTMGALHEGHAALIACARAKNDVVIVTAFVNPLQFNSAQDLALYPATPEADAELARSVGATALVRPSVNEMWPHLGQPTTVVSVPGISERFEGADRPGHFDGVATVVAKLFAVTGTCRAYFGEKDYQQLCVVRQLARDLALDVEIVAVATVRDEHGLALSSRNRRLSDAGRISALGLVHALTTAQALAASEPPSLIIETMRAIATNAGVSVSYVAIVDNQTLEPVGDDARGSVRALIAGVVDGVRLLDNAPLELGGPHAAGH